MRINRSMQHVLHEIALRNFREAKYVELELERSASLPEGPIVAKVSGFRVWGFWLREVERDREDSERVSRTIVVRQPSRDLARDCSSSKSPGLRPTQELICGFQTRRLSLWVGRDFRKLEKSVAPPFAGLTTDRSSGLYSWLPQQISTRIPLTHTLANSISLRFLTICMVPTRALSLKP